MDFTRPKERILFFISLIYLFAFSSLYIQLPGLYSRNGILPVDKLQLLLPAKMEHFAEYPNLLRLTSIFNLDRYDALEIITFFGALISFLAVAFESFRSMTTFIMLWLGYFACYSSGQVFMHFQWDILLLEAGFLAILLARADLILISLPKHSSSDRIVMFLLKWLLFRLMFASGVVKLTSGCPAWWGLEALNYHFETQCLPTPLAFYAHQLPEWFLKLSVVATYYIEILAPLLFFVPLKGVRLFSFYSQVLLQISIILTGNYNFFNILTIALCYSLLTDDDFCMKKPAPLPSPVKGKGKKQTAVLPPVKSTSRVSTVLSHLISVILIVTSFCVAVVLFKLEIDGNTVHTSVGFDQKKFRSWLIPAVTYSIIAALLTFVLVIYSALKDAISSPGFVKKAYNFTGVVFIALLSSLLLFSSIDVFAKGVAPEVTKSMPPSFAKISHQLNRFEITNSYGLFRRMTTVRNEVIIEASETEKGPWKSIEFMHKPGSPNVPPTIVTPHQPRVDWQMWFAALSGPEHNLWLYSLLHGILEGRPEVLGLLDVNLGAFKKPQFVRANLVNYKFAKLSGSPLALPKQWWTVASQKKPYIPAVSLASPVLKEKLSEAGILGTRNPPPSRENQITMLLRDIRSKIGQPRNLHPLLLVVLLVLLTKLRK